MHWRRDDINDPAHTTCQWILGHKSYKRWYKNQRGLLWIKGKPGAGKSTVLKYAFKAAKRNGEGLILASFFFHGRGSLVQKSPLGLFRSLLHQILQQVPTYSQSSLLFIDIGVTRRGNMDKSGIGVKEICRNF